MLGSCVAIASLSDSAIQYWLDKVIHQWGHLLWDVLTILMRYHIQIAEIPQARGSDSRLHCVCSRVTEAAHKLKGLWCSMRHLH